MSIFTLYKIDFNIQIQAEALEACINRCKKLGHERIYFSRSTGMTRRDYTKSCTAQSNVADRWEELISWIAMTFAGGHRDESRIVIHALVHYASLHRDCIEGNLIQGLPGVKVHDSLLEIPPR